MDKPNLDKLNLQTGFAAGAEMALKSAETIASAEGSESANYRIDPRYKLTLPGTGKAW
jgi:hypothetical protein